MGLFFRIFRHLLPDSIAFRIGQRSGTWLWDDGHTWDEPGLIWDFYPGGRTIDRFFDGLAGAFENARTFVDRVWEDAFPSTTRELPSFETQFGLLGTGNETDRTAELEASWQETGGQSPRYLQDQIQAAGFDLYVHEWWSPTVRDPRDYTAQALLGNTRCGMPSARCGVPGARCDRFLNNDVGYLFNSNRSQAAPPALPGDDRVDRWAYFLYWGPAVLDNPPTVPKAQIASSRRAELERRLLKICPSHAVLVLYVDFVDDAELGDS